MDSWFSTGISKTDLVRTWACQFHFLHHSLIIKLPTHANQWLIFSLDKILALLKKTVYDYHLFYGVNSYHMLKSFRDLAIFLFTLNSCNKSIFHHQWSLFKSLTKRMEGLEIWGSIEIIQMITKISKNTKEVAGLLRRLICHWVEWIDT